MLFGNMCVRFWLVGVGFVSVCMGWWLCCVLWKGSVVEGGGGREDE